MVNFLQEDSLEKGIKIGLNRLGLKISKTLRSKHPIRRVDSFKYAFKGVFHTLTNEPNFRIQLVIVLATILIGFFYKISSVEWGLLVITSGLLLSAEMVNTVMEELMDNLIPEQSPVVAVIKDLSAGFVLIMAFTDLAVLILIFGKYIFTIS